jgi:hypothetical protein
MLTTIAALVCAPAAMAKQVTVTGLARETPVREYAGWVLFSRWDGSAYRLATVHEGAVRDLPVPPSKKPFDADVGPDSHGDPAAVVSVCRSSCDLYTVGFEPGDDLRPIRNANTSNRDEVAPSIWKGRLVFGRRYTADETIPYTKALMAPRSKPSTRLAGLPDERCGAIEPPRCRRIEDVTLGAMDLWGRWVAQRWTYQPDDFAGFHQNEIRVTNLARTHTRQVAYGTTGEGGQTYLGPTIAEGRVAFYRACQVDRGGCSTKDSGAIRYRISTEKYELDGAVTGWEGWTWSGTAGYHVPSAFDCGGGDPGEQPSEACAIYRRDDLAWTSAAAARFVR